MTTNWFVGISQLVHEERFVDCHTSANVHKYENGSVIFVNGISIKYFAKGLTLRGISLSLEQELSTPLHVAAQEGHNDTCEVLVGKGADVNAYDQVRNKFSLPYTVLRLE